MPSKSGTSSLSERLAEQGVHEVHQEAMTCDIPVSGFQRLPAGIETGVAQLVKITFGTYDEESASFDKTWVGKDFVSMTGVMLEPDEHEGHPVKNLQTWVNKIPLFETTKKDKSVVPFGEHWKKFMIELRKLAGPDVDIDPATIEDFCADLVDPENPPVYFGVRTWKGKKQEIVEKNGKFWMRMEGKPDAGPFVSEQALKARYQFAGVEPRVNEVWTGRLWDYVPAEVNGTVDESGPAGETEESPAPAPSQARAPRRAAPAPAPTPSRNGPARNAARNAPVADPAPQRAAPSRRAATPAPAPEPEPDEVPADEGAFSEFGDLDALAAAVDAESDVPQKKKSDAAKEAAVTLREFANKAGISDEQVDDAPDWVAVVAMINEAGGGAVPDEAGADDAESEPETFVPKVGEVYDFKPINPTTRKPGKEIVEVRVLSVYSRDGTALCASTDDPKRQYKGVKYDQLIAKAD